VSNPLINRLSAVERAFGYDERVALLQRFGAAHVQHISPEQCDDFIAFAEASVLFGVPPSASWWGCIPAEYIVPQG
jgi:hypothetical protein